jgi:hypothetical protein
MCGNRTPGPTCQVENPVEIDDGTMCVAATPVPGPVCASPPTSCDTGPPATVATYSAPLQAFESASIYLGAESTWDSIVRDVYKAGAEAIRAQGQELVRTGQMTAEQAKVWTNGQRNALLQATRDETGPIGRAIAVAIKSKGKSVADLEAAGKSAAGIIESAGKSNAIVNRVAVGMKFAGPALLVIGLGFSAYNIATAPPNERWRVTAQEAGTWAGALAGGWAGGETGGEVGAGIGTFVEPGGGTAVGGAAGAIIGGIGGAIAGGWAGSKVGEYVYRSLDTPASSEQVQRPARDNVGNKI